MSENSHDRGKVVVLVDKGLSRPLVSHHAPASVLSSHCYTVLSYNYCPKPRCLSTNIFQLFVNVVIEIQKKQASFQRSKRYKHLRRESREGTWHIRAGQILQILLSCFKSFTGMICLNTTKVFQGLYCFIKTVSLLCNCNNHTLFDIINKYYFN